MLGLGGTEGLGHEQIPPPRAVGREVDEVAGRTHRGGAVVVFGCAEHIDGEFRKTKRDLPVVNPATEEEIGRLPHADKGDLDDALAAAESGFKIWSRTPPVERATVLVKAAALMRQRQEEIAAADGIVYG